MRTQVNPGRLLEVTGSFELRQSALVVEGEFSRIGVAVVDRESTQIVDLGGLLRSFLEDPDDTVTGPIRIRIEAA